MTHATSVLHFWFEELAPKQHFVKDTALDETIRTRFGDTPRNAILGRNSSAQELTFLAEPGSSF